MIEQELNCLNQSFPDKNKQIKTTNLIKFPTQKGQSCNLEFSNEKAIKKIPPFKNLKTRRFMEIVDSHCNSKRGKNTNPALNTKIILDFTKIKSPPIAISKINNS